MDNTANNSFNNIVRNRRSVYPPMFKPDKISDETIIRILENANQAPTHKKTEPWRFIVFSGKALNELSHYSGEWYKANTHESKYSQLKYNKTKNKALQSSHVIAIIMEVHNDMLPEWEEVAAVACAVQNMWLTVTSMGLAGYWSTPKYATEGGQFLNLNENQKCLGLFYIGIPQDNLPDQYQPGKVENKIEWR